MFKPGNAQPSGDPGVLVVRLGSMGDVIHALPAVATLKHSLPGRHVSWVIDPRWACLLEGNPFVDQVVHLDRRTLAGIKHAWRELRARRYALAVDFQGLCKSALAASCARPDRIYGFHQSQAREPVAALFYSKRVRTRAAHVVDRNLELAAAAGASSILYTFPLPAGRAEGELPAGDFVLASPFAGWAGKQWPLEYYTLLAQLLQRDLGLPLVLSGPPQAAGRLAQVAGAVAYVSTIPGLIHATRRATAVVRHRQRSAASRRGARQAWRGGLWPYRPWPATVPTGRASPSCAPPARQPPIRGGRRSIPACETSLRMPS